MDSRELVKLGLALEEPWQVEDVWLDKEVDRMILHVQVGHKKGARFEVDGESCSVYDHQQRSWHHLNFFEHYCQIHARVPRIKLPTGEVRLVEVPWAQAGSRFTLKFEYEFMSLVKGGMSVSAASRKMSISSKRGQRIINRHVSHALATQALDSVKELSVDETSAKKGHNYLTIMTDREARKVVGIGYGKDSAAYHEALIDMEIRGAFRENVETIAMDMSPSYISATAQYIPKADVVFDRFHIIKQLNEAIDEIRRQDRREYAQLKGSRYLWLKNYDSLSDKQQAKLDELSEACPNIGQAHRLKELLKLVLDEAKQNSRIGPLNAWIKEAWASGIEPIRKFVNMLHRHWYGIKTYFKKLQTNAFAESVNLKIQQIKRSARGYRNHNNFYLMIYFHLGRLDLIPTKYG